MDKQASLLVVDDENVVRESLGKWFEEEGYVVETATSAREALLKMARQRWDLALLDIKMPGMDGLELHRKIREVDGETIVIIMTGYASVETAVQALKDGAYDYITKPFDPDDLARLVRKALEHRQVKEENVRLRESLAEAQAVEMVGQSGPMQRVLELVRTVAPLDTTVLIHGESGTGKELVARAIHQLSPRRFMPLVALHCGALTETLLESELFGHEKGAFTGAQYRKKGKFEVAEGGTVFLDEIADISLKTQTDLLRVLQEKEITRVGGNQVIKVDFRAVAASNKDLGALVNNKMPMRPHRRPGGTRPRVSIVLRVPSAGGGREAARVLAGRLSLRPRRKSASPSTGRTRSKKEEGQSVSQVPHLLLGPDSMDDRNCSDSVRGASSLAGLLHHLGPARCERRGRVFRGAPGWQGHRRLEGRARDQGRVLRDGKWINPAARELVPGDVIRLRLGDIVPADARLLEGESVEVDQSALTGESLPATRATGDAVFSASIIRQGEIGALVYGTGANTYFGKTAELVQDAQTVSHFQRAVLRIGKFLILFALVMVAVITVVSIIRGNGVLTTCSSHWSSPSPRSRSRCRRCCR